MIKPGKAAIMMEIKKAVKNFFRPLGLLLILCPITLICFIPTELFLVLRYVIEPYGFWQNFAVFGLGVYFLGALQVFGIVFWLLTSISLILEWLK